MKELTILQKQVLQILQEHSRKRDLLLDTKICTLTNKQVYELSRIKPTDPIYVTHLLVSLKKKGQIDISREQIQGKGLKRIITIL